MTTKALHILTLMLALLSPRAAMAGQESDYGTLQGPLDPSVRTVRLTSAADWLAPPVLNLYSRGPGAVLEFDMLEADRRWLRWSLTPCDAQWQPEQLADPEFLDSFNEGRIDDVDFSQATLAGYVHYRLVLPQPDVKVTLPGNYLLRVWDESDPDTPLLQARLQVCDFSVPLAATVTSRTDGDVNGHHQQLELRADLSHLPGADPWGELRLVVSQNGRPDTRRIIDTPLRMQGREAVYAHRPPLIFAAGNEYRRFDTSSLTFPGIGVESLDHDGPVVNAVLVTDVPRAHSGYLYDSTQHGRMLPHTVEAPSEAATRADYVLTHFSLLTPQLEGYEIFIEGDLTHRTFGPGSRMDYNRATGCYELSMLLKQGACNYQYVAIPTGSGPATALTAPVEGDKFETVNEYTVEAYWRPRGSRHERLVGFTRISSGT